MSNGRVTMLGGTGFVGTELACRLAAQFSEVVILSRHSQRSRQLRILPNVQVEQVDVHDSAALGSAVAGSDLVINLVGVLNSSGSNAGNSFNGAHAALTASVVAACEKHAVPHYVHMSALNADAKNGNSEYLRSKGEAEDHVRGSTVPRWSIFQPSVIFGEGDAFLNRFAALLESLPFFPLACPDARMAPVFVGDVCDAIMQSINSSATETGETIQLCGPADYTLQELVEFTASTCGLKRRILRLPDGLARLQARVMEWVPGKPFSMDNYLSLQIDSVCESGCARQPTSLQAMAPRYLGGGGGITRRHQSRREIARR